jgi:serine/threonine protein phosphatase PrpC
MTYSLASVPNPTSTLYLLVQMTGTPNFPPADSWWDLTSCPHALRYLILGCDGLWDEVDEARVGELFTKWRKQIKEQAQQRQEDQSRLRRMTSTSSNGRNKAAGLSISASGLPTNNGEVALEAYQLARMLVDYSFASGSYDNISVIVVQLKE